MCGDISTMGPSALSAGILAFVEGRTGRDAGDETATVTAAASETAKGDRDGLANKGKVAALDSSDREGSGSNGNDSGSFIRGIAFAQFPCSGSVSGVLQKDARRAPQSLTRFYFVPI